MFYENLREGILAALFLTAAWRDLHFRKIPNRLLRSAAGLRLLFCLPETYLAGWKEMIIHILQDLGSSLILMTFLLTVTWVCGKGKKLGMGDVKLAGTAALFAGLYLSLIHI